MAVVPTGSELQLGLRQLAVGDRWSNAFTSLAPPPWIDAAVKAPAADAAPAVLPSPAATGLHLSSAPPKSDDASPPRRKATQVYQESSTDSSDEEYVALKRSTLRRAAASNKAATAAPAAPPTKKPADAPVGAAPTAAPAAPAPTIVAPGFVVKGGTEKIRRSNVIGLLANLGHTAFLRNSRPGYDFLNCHGCGLKCGISKNTGDSSSWIVTTASPEVSRLCGVHQPLPTAAGGVHQPLPSAFLPAALELDLIPVIPAAAQQQDMIPSVIDVSCDTCFDRVKEQDSVTCENNHIICNTCFDHYVHAQLTVDKAILQFQSNGGKIHCPGCKGRHLVTPYSTRTIAMHATAEVYAQYIQLTTDTAVMKARDPIAKKLSEAQDEIERLKADDPDEVEIGTLLLFNFSVVCNRHAVYCRAACS